MWRLAYNLFVHALFPVFAAFAVTNGKIRKTFFERMFGSTTGELRGAVWIHAASLGEAVIAENLIDFLRPRTPDPFVVTTNTYYARDLLRRKLKDRAEVTSMPFDLPYSVNRFMGNSTFSALILIETEIWPNLIWSAKKRGIPVIIINGRISDRTIGRYRRLSFFLKKVLASVDLVLAQSQEQARRFVSLGMKPARVIETGNLKYYRTLETGTLPKKENMVTFGSIREKEMDEITPVIAGLIKMFPAIRIFIVPREIQLIESIEKQLPGGVKISRYSDVKHNITPENEIVLVDTVGDLVGIYARSAVAFVGGSLAPYGGQNLLEPLFVGTPVLFGPHIENFKAIGEDIIEVQAGFMVRDGQDLYEKITMLLTDNEARRASIDAGRRLVEKQKGAMEKTASLVLETIWKNSPNL